MNRKQAGLPRKIAAWLLVAMLVTSLLFSPVTCGKSTTPPQTTSHTSTLPLTTKWSADGVITSNEYANNVTYDNGNFEINWKTDTQYIYIGIKAKTTGWVAIGFNATSQMQNIDYVFGWVSNGKVYVSDQFSADFHGQHKADTSDGGTEDITEFGGQENGGYTVLEFKRALVTGDVHDAVLTSGNLPIIWAYSSSDDINHSCKIGEI